MCLFSIIIITDKQMLYLKSRGWLLLSTKHFISVPKVCRLPDVVVQLVTTWTVFNCTAVRLFFSIPNDIKYLSRMRNLRSMSVIELAESQL